MKKILIGKRESKSINDNLLDVCSRLTVMLSEIKEFIILDDEVFNDILQGGINTRKGIEDSLNGEIEKMTILAFKKEIEIKAQDVLSEFDSLTSKVRDIISSKPSFIPVEIFLLEDNSVILDKNKLTPLIDEAINIYISEEKDIRLHDLCKEIQPKIKEIFELISPYWNISLFEHENTMSLFDRSLNVNINVIASLAYRRDEEEKVKQLKSK